MEVILNKLRNPEIPKKVLSLIFSCLNNLIQGFD